MCKRPELGIGDFLFPSSQMHSEYLLCQEGHDNNKIPDIRMLKTKIVKIKIQAIEQMNLDSSSITIPL